MNMTKQIKLAVSISPAAGRNFLTIDLALPVSYSRKVWREESLANSANKRRFVKLKPAKSFHPVQIYLASYRQIRQTFSRAKIVSW